MPERRVVLPPEQLEVGRRLAPATKRKVRAALDELVRDPDLGEPLRRELTGLRRLRVGELRVVYRATATAVEIVAVGPRRTIYADLARSVRSPTR